MLNIEIINCYDCPFRNNDFEQGSNCNLNYDITDYEMPGYEESFIPEKCPLRKNNINIKLKDANIRN